MKAFNFFSLRPRGILQLKLETYKVNNSLNCIKYESKCLKKNLPDSACDNNVQTIDRSFLSWLPTQSTNHFDLNVEKIFTKN